MIETELKSRSPKTSQLPVFNRLEFALGVLTTMVVAILIWLVSDKIAGQYTRKEVLDLLPALGTLFIASISIYLSYFALSEQRKARQAATDPVILVYLTGREDNPIMTTIEVANVGAGAAKNVAVKIGNENIREFLASKRIIHSVAKIGHPIQAIPQDSSVSFNFGVSYRLLEEPIIPPIKVLVEYEDIDGVAYTSTQWLDVRELRGQRADKPVATRIGESLAKMEKSLSNLSSESRTFHTVTQSVLEYEADKQREREEMIAFLRTHEEKGE